MAKACIISDPTAGLRYFIDAQHEIVFDGNTYTPQLMSWSGMELSSQMQLPAVQLTIPDLTGAIEDYLEEVNMLGRDITLQILHLDLLNDATDVSETHMQVMAVGGGEGVIIFGLGINVGLNDPLPKDIINSQEFPSIPTRLRKATIL